jgi:hypothetical protein
MGGCGWKIGAGASVGGRGRAKCYVAPRMCWAVRCGVVWWCCLVVRGIVSRGVFARTCRPKKQTSGYLPPRLSKYEYTTSVFGGYLQKCQGQGQWCQVGILDPRVRKTQDV